MKLRGTLLAALCAVLAAAPVGAQTTAFDAAQRSSIIDGIQKAMSSYIDPQVTNAVREKLDADRTTLTAIGDPEAFAKAVSEELHAAGHDKHLNLVYSAELPPPSDDPGKPTKEQLAHVLQSDRVHNGGVRGAYWLPGNIGYINLRGFPGLNEASQHSIDAAMATVANTDALIIDLRKNGGGDPDSLDYWMGYFFAKPTELTSIHWITPTPHVDRQFSAAKIAGPHYDKPIYVLTSARTFSCAEQFAYDMQSLKRATLIGETTGGGANPGGFNRLDAHFAVFVPNGRAYNPYTKTNWEGTGVRPEIAVASSDALLKAYTTALQNSTNSFDELVVERTEILKDPAAVLKPYFPQP